MATDFPPPPRREKPIDASGMFSRVWERWFLDLARMLDVGAIGWTSIDFTDSDHEDIEIFQGGTTDEHYHLTEDEYTYLQRQELVEDITADTSLNDTHGTVVAKANKLTVTLPAASTTRIGKKWDVQLGVNGWVNITRAGSDTLLLPETETTVQIDEKGSTVTFRCLSATEWGIA